jgi:GYF domain 2
MNEPAAILVSKNNQQLGPFPEEEVRQKVFRGELSLSDIGWRSGLAGWISLSELLGIAMPPPLPGAAGEARAVRRTTSGKRSSILLVCVILFGLAGAIFDIYTGNGILSAVQGLKTEVAGDHPLVRLGLEWLYESYGNHAIEIAQTAAHILLFCGIAGGLVTLSYLLRRYTMILAALLILLGIGPLFHHPLEFVGLPMALAGVLGFFVKR